MDQQTLKYYSVESAYLARKYDSCAGGIDQYFQKAFEPGMRILDIGCGSGRDLRYLHELGFNADGVDPCQGFVDIVNNNKTGYGSVVTQDQLPELKTINDGKYDGVLCSAVLMHLPEEQLFDASFAIRRILKQKGRLLLSIPLQDETIDSTTKRDVNGRFFNGVTPEELQLLFERIGFNLLNRWDNSDSLNREHRKWATMLFELESATGTRPIDTIESVLNKDNKVATYKLALFRAFAEIATTNYKLAAWQQDGRVKIPVQALAEKWIEYYWPIIESDKNIPQTTGQAIAFRKQLEDLVKFYRNRGGLSAFSLEYRNGSLNKESDFLLREVFKKLKHTIWNQPVRYAGGGGDFSVFQYDKKDKTVLIGNDTWKELSLMGAWIKDATILRWAELTAKIAKNNIKPSEVIDCLLTVPVQEREVNAAKTFYDALKTKECVWTGQKIGNKYDLDHAIPFALWKNNDLWNLLPADSKVNGNKKDKLPENRLVKARKDSIIHYWDLIKNEFPARFEYEAEKLVGAKQYDSINWENKLFATFAEAIEITAIQRGVARWAPVNFAATGTENAYSVFAEKPTYSNPTVSLPFFPSLKIACGVFKASAYEFDQETMEVENPHNNLDPKKHFIVRASGDSMDGGNRPIRDGDLLILELNEGGTVSNQIFAIEYQEKTGDTTYVLKRIEKQPDGSYELVSANKRYKPIPVDPENMFPFARFKYKI